MVLISLGLVSSSGIVDGDSFLIAIPYLPLSMEQTLWLFVLSLTVGLFHVLLMLHLKLVQGGWVCSRGREEMFVLSLGNLLAHIWEWGWMGISAWTNEWQSCAWIPPLGWVQTTYQVVLGRTSKGMSLPLGWLIPYLHLFVDDTLWTILGHSWGCKLVRQQRLKRIVVPNPRSGSHEVRIKGIHVWKKSSATPLA